MARPYPIELRERAIARVKRGQTIRQVSEALIIAPSAVSKWTKRLRETGSLKPGKMGGHRPRTLAGETAAWLRLRIGSGEPFTLRGLTAELALRGVKTAPRAVWVFVHEEGLSFKKNRAAQRAKPA